MRLDARWQSRLSAGDDLLSRPGSLPMCKHAVTRISGHVSFSLEARSLNSYTLTAFAEEIMATAHQVSEARGVTFRFDSPVLTGPLR
jgi:N-carbamoyl-L-amino-acid hydrolase